MESKQRRNSSEIVKFSGSPVGSFCRDKKLDRMLPPVGKWSRAYWGQNLDCHQHLPPASQDLPDFLLISLRFATYFSPICTIFLSDLQHIFLQIISPTRMHSHIPLKALCLFGLSSESPCSDSILCQLENGFRVLTWPEDGWYGRWVCSSWRARCVV